MSATDKYNRETAYVTGGASGIGKALVRRLTDQRVRVCIADINQDAAETLASELNREHKSKGNGSNDVEEMAMCVKLDVVSWDSQVTAMKQAVDVLGRIDHVFAVAGIGERPWLLSRQDAVDDKDFFPKPDLSVLNVDLNGLIYTVTVAIHQFRRQGLGRDGFRGKIACVASICGFYSVPTLPIYTAAKFGVTGFVRSFGKYLVEERITLNAVSPNVVRTGIYVPGEFYEKLGERRLFTPVEGVVDVFIRLMGMASSSSGPGSVSDDDDEMVVSGKTFEVGPNYDTVGVVTRHDPDFLDPKTEAVCDLINESWLPLYRNSKKPQSDGEYGREYGTIGMLEPAG